MFSFRHSDGRFGKERGMIRVGGYVFLTSRCFCGLESACFLFPLDGRQNLAVSRLYNFPITVDYILERPR